MCDFLFVQINKTHEIIKSCRHEEIMKEAKKIFLDCSRSTLDKLKERYDVNEAQTD